MTMQSEEQERISDFKTLQTEHQRMGEKGGDRENLTVVSEPKSRPLEYALRFPDTLQGILHCTTRNLTLDTFSSYSRQEAG